MTKDKQSLKASIEKHLEEETQNLERGAPERVQWLVRQISEYIDRWLGFCLIPEISMAAVLKGDLFNTIQAGSELLESELGEAAGTRAKISPAWDAFITQLRTIRTSTNKEDARRLSEAFGLVRTNME